MAGGNKGDQVQVKLRGNVISLPVYADGGAGVEGAMAAIHRGTLVNINQYGFAIQAADVSGEVFAGVSEEAIAAKASGVVQGAYSIRVRRRGIFKMKLDATTAAAACPSLVGSLVYVCTAQAAEADETVGAAAQCTTGSVLVGMIVKHGTEAQAKAGTTDVTAVWVAIIGAPSATLYASTYTRTVDLASAAATAGFGAKGIGLYDVAAKFDALNVEDAFAELVAITNGNGASLVGLEDSGTFTTAADVEAALAEIYQHIISTKAILHLPLGSWQEQDGTALAVHSAAPTPGFHATAEGFGIQWAAHANPDPIACSVPIPDDLDASANVIVHVLAAKTGATEADAVTWLIEAFNNADGAAYDADTDFGGTSSAMTGTATAKTCQEETLTLASSNVAGSPCVLQLTLQPTDGTLGTDDVIVLGVWLEYTRKILTS